jgi:hypothetical protein
MKVYGWADVEIHVFLISAPVGGEWSDSCPGRFTPEERSPGTHWIGGWLDSRTGLYDVENIKILPLPGLEPRLLSIVQPVASLYTNYAIPALTHSLVLDHKSFRSQPFVPTAGLPHNTTGSHRSRGTFKNPPCIKHSGDAAQTGTTFVTRY